MSGGRIMKIHALDHRIGNFEHGDAEMVIRLWADPHKDNGKIMWVDWALFEPLCVAAGGVREYTRRDAGNSLDTVTDMDEAAPIAEGMVKWDGCTQFNADIHIDSVGHLDDILDAIKTARRLAAGLMPDMMIAEEYAP